jgi:hypothetical protein
MRAAKNDARCRPHRASVARVERSETQGSALWLLSPFPDFARLNPATRSLICESKNRRAISSLAENLRIMAAQSQLRGLNSEQRVEKDSRKIRQIACIGKFS